jgi:hypothetical protein
MDSAEKIDYSEHFTYCEDEEVPKLMCEFSFHFNDDDFDVNEITKRLGVTPTTVFNKGDEDGINPQTGEKLYHGYREWELATEYKTTYDASDVIDEIIEKIKHSVKEIIKLQKEYNIECSMCVVTNVEGQTQPSLFLSREHIAFLHSINAAIDFDQYWYGSDNCVKEYIPKKERNKY